MLGDNWNLSGTVGGSGLHLCFYQKASEQVQFGVEMETSARESVATFGYQVKLCLIGFTCHSLAINYFHLYERWIYQKPILRFVE